MDAQDLQEMMDDVAEVMKALVENATSPLIKRIADLESALKALPAPPMVLALEDFMPVINQGIGTGLAEMAETLKAPSLDDVMVLLEERMTPFELAMKEVAETAARMAVEALSKPLDGKDGANGVDGKDGAPGEKGVDGLNGKDGKAGLDGKDGANGLDGKDGCGIRDLMIDRDRNLIATFDDGRLKSLGIVVGLDGKDGAAGEKGAEGTDGLGFDDMAETVEEDGRTIVRRFSRGSEVKEFRHAVKAMLYRGVFAEGTEYLPGDVVTWAGSSWHCDVATSDKPEERAGVKAWTLMVKRGRDGKQVTLDEVKPLVADAVAKATKAVKP